MVLLAAASIVLVVDLFISDERRNLTYGLTMLALLAAASVCIALAQTKSWWASRHVHRRPDGPRAKAVCDLLLRLYADMRAIYARARGLWRANCLV